MTRPTPSTLGPALLVAALLLAPARGGAGDGDLPELPAAPAAPAADVRVPDDAEPEAAPVKVSTMPWHAVPPRARAAVRRIAALEKATPSRCLVLERDDTVTYEFRGWRRTGPLRREEVVLVRVSEPLAEAEARRHASSLPGRLERLAERTGLKR
jgi:hypothetical protein